MKRFAAVLSLAAVLTIGASSSASAAGDPLHADACVESWFCSTLVDVSVRQLVPASSYYLCSAENEIRAPEIRVPIPDPTTGRPAGFLVAHLNVCEQP